MFIYVPYRAKIRKNLSGVNGFWKKLSFPEKGANVPTFTFHVWERISITADSYDEARDRLACHYDHCDYDHLEEIDNISHHKVELFKIEREEDSPLGNPCEEVGGLVEDLPDKDE